MSNAKINSHNGVDLKILTTPNRVTVDVSVVSARDTISLFSRKVDEL